MGAQKFRKKPVVIEAVQLLGSPDGIADVHKFVNGKYPDTESRAASDAWDNYTTLVVRDGYKIPTLEGEMTATVGDWIIKGVKGEFYPCKPDIFAATYGSEEDTVEKYDSTADTLFHIKRVSQLLTEAATELLRRAAVHDNSKLRSPEKELFDEFTPKLKGSTYGSDEYKSFLTALKPALDHHYANNSHHPEYYYAGVDGMNLFDLIEMFLDWQAATERHEDGDIMKSIDINRDRFKLSDQVAAIFRNTAQYLNFSSDEPV